MRTHHAESKGSGAKRDAPKGRARRMVLGRQPLLLRSADRGRFLADMELLDAALLALADDTGPLRGGSAVFDGRKVRAR